MSRPSQPLRLLIALALILSASLVILTLLRATDAALATWERLQVWPSWVQIGFLLILSSLIFGSAYGIWRLLRPRAPRPVKVEAIDRAALEERIVNLGSETPEAFEARSELEELDRRRRDNHIHVCLFGQISTGKSSLLKALAPEATLEIDVIGGSTTDITHHQGELPDGQTLIVADVPGSAEAGDTVHLQLARAEAARSHALIYVTDSDLNRSQVLELKALAAFGRPIVLTLNKADRFDRAQTQALLTRLKEHAQPLFAEVISVSAAYQEEVVREHADGRQETLTRTVPPRIEQLQYALTRIAKLGTSALEAGREAALLSHVDARLDEGERRIQKQRSDTTIDKYTRRAVVGALAAVAPGSDLVIQGALATALTRELCQIHGLRARDVDVDELLARAGGLLRTGSSITLAIVGNALKAFPGFGTLGGGLVHAVAYGLIFDSLGNALADTLANTRHLDREATLDAFRDRLSAPSTERLLSIAKMALQQNRNADDEPR